jgi:hypothetical protein
LRAYKNETNNCDVPKDFKSADGFRLGTWLVNIRKAKKAVPFQPNVN